MVEFLTLFSNSKQAPTLNLPGPYQLWKELVKRGVMTKLMMVKSAVVLLPEVREQGADSAFPVVHFNFQVWNSMKTESANIGQPDVPL